MMWHHSTYYAPICTVRTILHRRCFYESRRNRVHLQYAFWCAHKIVFQPSVSHQLSLHTKHVQFHICIYFRFLAVCITLIAKPTCIYFWYLAVCITLIAKILCTLLHLAGYFFIFCFLEERLFKFKSNLQDCQTKDHQRVSIDCRTVLGGEGWRWKQMHWRMKCRSR